MCIDYSASKLSKRIYALIIESSICNCFKSHKNFKGSVIMSLDGVRVMSPFFNFVSF